MYYVVAAILTRSFCCVLLSSVLQIRGAVRLHYFNFRGRLEPARLMLEDAQSAYELRVYNLDDHWSDVKAELEPKLLFGQLPLLEDGDFAIAQTPSIIRYISRKLDLLPTSLADTARADMVADATQELADRWMTKVVAHANSSKACREYLRHATRILTGLEKILKAKNEGKAYFISDTVRQKKAF